MYREEECLAVARAKQTDLGIDIHDELRVVSMLERLAVGAFLLPHRASPPRENSISIQVRSFCHYLRPRFC